MTKDSPSLGAGSGGAGGPPPPAPPPAPVRLSPRRGPPLLPPPPPPTASPQQHEEQRREVELLRAELEAERLRSQEARRRGALEARELREAAERERQLLADQLRSKWEQQRARELHQLREAGRRQREAEIRQLLRWKEAELREAQELLQRERDAAMRQARDLQRQLAEELVGRGYGGGGGGGGGRGSGGGGAGLSGECRAKLQEVLGKLRWEVDGEQAARIRHLKAELELERSLFLKYILERFEGEPAPAGFPHRLRQQAASQQQHPPPPPPPKAGKAASRPRSLESLLEAACSSAPEAASKSRSLDSNLSRGEAGQQPPPQPQRPLLEEGGPAASACPPPPALEKEEGAKPEESLDSPPEGKVSRWRPAGGGSPPASLPQQQQQQQQAADWLSGSRYNQLVKQNGDLLSALVGLEQRFTRLKEENALLRRNNFPEMHDKVKRLKRKNEELAGIAKRLEEGAKKLQESSLKVGGGPVPLGLDGPDLDLCKSTFARQRARDLSERASVLLAKDQQLEALQRECWELQARLSAGKEDTYLLSISDFDRLLRESQREVLRLQRQITLKNLRESLQSSRMGSNDASPSVNKQEMPPAVDVCLDDSSVAKEKPEPLDALAKDVQSEALPLESVVKNCENSSAIKTGADSKHQLEVLKTKFAEQLNREVLEKQKRCDDLEQQLREVLSENVRIAAANSQLHQKNERAEKLENENAKMKAKLTQAADDWNASLQLRKAFEIRVANLEQVIKDMKETAERQQQLEQEKTSLVLQNKEKEIQHLKQVQTEIKREHEEAVQLLEAQVKELEDQYHSQTEHFNLLSQELERQQRRSGCLESELSHGKCNPTAMNSPETLEQDTCHTLHCNSDAHDQDSESTADMLKTGKDLSQSNSSGSESMQNSSKSCLNPEEDTAGEMEELEADKGFLNLPPGNQGASKLSVFLARYSYDPFDGPNKNPEAELPLTAGEYVYVFGEMDEEGFYEGELMDGRRGIVPSNLVEEVSGNDLISFAPSEPSDLSYNSCHEMGFPGQSASSGEKSNSPDENACSLPSNQLEDGPFDSPAVVPYPQNLTLLQQFARSVVISWEPPDVPHGWGNVHGYNIYVNTGLCQNVKHSSPMKAVVENLDLALQTYRISVQSVTDRGNSDHMQCTFVVGNDSQVAPTCLKLQKITATSAEICWLPSNSNYTHAVYLNEKEYDVTKTGVYLYTFQNLRPSTQYSARVETLAFKEVLVFPQGNSKSAAITFVTPSVRPPDAPLDVQVQPGSSAGFLVISWLPVTIDAAGTSNGVKVTGYAVYISGEKVTEVASPTAGTVSLDVSQLHPFQGSQKVSVRTVSPFGESEDSVPTLIPSTLLRAPCLSKSVDSSHTPEWTFQEFFESEGGCILATACTSSPSVSHGCTANTHNNFTIHFTSNCKDSVVSVPVNNSPNPMPCFNLTSSQSASNKDEGNAVLQTSAGKQTSEHSFPASRCDGPVRFAPAALQIFAAETKPESSEEHPSTQSQPDKSKIEVYTMTQCTDTTAKDLSFPSYVENSGANGSNTEPGFSPMGFEARDSICRDVGMQDTCLQEEPGSFSEKRHAKQIQQLCRELSNLSVSKSETKEEDLSRTESCKTALGDHSHNSDLSDIEEEEEEDQQYRMAVSGHKDSRPRKRPISPAELAKDKIITKTLRVDQTTTPSVPNSSPQKTCVLGDTVDPTRLFVALFDYDPLTMSPNSNGAEDELLFKEGQILKSRLSLLGRGDRGCCHWIEAILKR
ncbi:peripheral-type benzodiazepine receptor-associated protein 1-like isoform X2 [Hemicordylus capensis]|uniref:peripheral-type benzodiazepine receptor-associated protein 1-like isoform X2 n=1 Tax=Hemicordylus capensis TaxID=884348 RepID=UPI0023026C5D|nr:peripheral-type benzodiazepine receptor-associated protein 1-like isoform X2 [Hemicordylus capensis]